MKTVLLLRHAKSDWGHPGLADFDRPLAKRGLQDAPRMGEVLAAYNAVPDQIISSTAKRAKETTNLVAEACGYRKSIQWADQFYGATSDDLIAALRGLPNTVERALLVGHNPTMEETAADLLVTPDENWGNNLSIQMPTAGLVCLDLSIMDWSTVAPGCAILRWYLIPRLVKAIV
ncbi:MAG: histidine phosphatase family protein [Chloroflexota bacterium]